MKKQTILLILIFVLALSFRLYFVFQTDTLDYDAYFNLRQVESIKETGLPIYQDDLSYGGRLLLFMPLYYYILAFFSLIMPLTFALKLIPNLCASTIVIITYLIAKKITKTENASLFCAFIAGFIPIFITETINSASIYSVVVPLTFLTIYFLMEINKKKYIYYFIASAILLTILHASSVLLVMGLLIYLLMVLVEDLNQKREEVEAILFLTFFSLWINFVIYKKAFLEHGAYVIWQNIPTEVFFFYFAQTNIIEAIIQIGLIPIILGAYVVLRYVFREKNREIYLIIGMALACFFLVWAKLLQPSVAFMFLGVILTILFAQSYRLFFDYLKQTKAAPFKKWFIALFTIIFILSSVIPASYFTKQVIAEAPSQKNIEAFEWIKKNSEEDDVILSSIQEGNMVNAIAKRKNIMDPDFLLIKNPEQRFEDVKRAYRSQYKTEAVPLLNKYNIRYIIFSDSAKNEFDIEEIRYISEDCFNLVFENDETKIFESLCKVEEI